MKKHGKGVYKSVHGEIQGWQLRSTIMPKLKQNENVSKTTGESNNFEGHIATTSGIVKIRSKFVSFLNAQNWHVRQTIRIMQRAQRSKMEEIGLK